MKKFNTIKIKAQAAIETLLVLAIVIAFVLPLVLMFFSSSNERLEIIEQAQAKALAQSIADKAGEVWYMGNGSKAPMLVNFPARLKNITLSGDFVADESRLISDGREITISYNATGSGVREIVIRSPAPMKSNPPSTLSGPDRIRASLPAIGGSALGSGPVVLIFENKGTYVNILRKVYGKVE
jgi:hypothetical protein